MKKATLFALVFGMTACLGLVGQGQQRCEPLPVQQVVFQQPAQPQPPAKEVKKKFPRGLKKTPRVKLAAAPRFHPKVTATPANYWRLPKKLNTWGNNQYGDCVTAESAFCRACAGVFISEQEVIRWARSNGVLNGANLDEVINAQQRDGFHQDGNVYGNGPGRVINYADAPTMKAAIYEAGLDKGSISIGISADMLPNGAGNDMGWFLTGDTNDDSEDHCVSLCGFGTAQSFVTNMNLAYGITISVPASIPKETQGYALYTWNTIGFVETSSCVGMMGEAWIRTPSTIIHGTNPPTPDEVYVGGDPVPPPPPPPPPPGPTPTPGVIPTMDLSATLPAGKYEIFPSGTGADIAASTAAAAKLAQTVTPIPPPSPPGTLEGRVGALESNVAEILKLLKERK